MDPDKRRQLLEKYTDPEKFIEQVRENARNRPKLFNNQDENEILESSPQDEDRDKITSLAMKRKTGSRRRATSEGATSVFNPNGMSTPSNKPFTPFSIDEELSIDFTTTVVEGRSRVITTQGSAPMSLVSQYNQPQRRSSVQPQNEQSDIDETPVASNQLRALPHIRLMAKLENIVNGDAIDAIDRTSMPRATKKMKKSKSKDSIVKTPALLKKVDRLDTPDYQDRAERYRRATSSCKSSDLIASPVNMQEPSLPRISTKKRGFPKPAKDSCRETKKTRLASEENIVAAEQPAAHDDHGMTLEAPADTDLQPMLVLHRVKVPERQKSASNSKLLITTIRDEELTEDEIISVDSSTQNTVVTRVDAVNNATVNMHDGISLIREEASNSHSSVELPKNHHKATKVRETRAENPAEEYSDSGVSDEDDPLVIYDPNQRDSCKREGLRVRRLSRPWWIHDGTEVDYYVKFVPMSLKMHTKEEKLKRQMEKVGIKPRTISPAKMRLLESLGNGKEQLQVLRGIRTKRDRNSRRLTQKRSVGADFLGFIEGLKDMKINDNQAGDGEPSTGSFEKNTVSLSDMKCIASNGVKQAFANAVTRVVTVNPHCRMKSSASKAEASIMMLSGEINVIVDKEKFPLKPFEFHSVPKGSYSAENVTKEPAVFVAFGST